LIHRTPGDLRETPDGADVADGSAYRTEYTTVNESTGDPVPVRCAALVVHFSNGSGRRIGGVNRHPGVNVHCRRTGADVNVAD
jgi:hypothetical protein